MSIDYLAHLRADSARFLDVLTAADPDARVPPCPDWTAADLLWHLGEVQHFWGTIVHDRLTDPRGSYEEPVRPDGHRALVDFFGSSSALLIDSLANTADDVAVWTWLDADQSVGFVRRRQAHEALIHRLDAELVAGAVTDLDAELATDGVLEAVEWMFGGAPGWATTEPDGPVGRLATTDTGGSWLVQVGRWSGTSPRTNKTYTDEHMLFLVPEGTPSFEISGTARDLDAWIWNRPPLGVVSRAGDTAAFEAIIKTGVQ
jgi:uncharacterized protein (TIGR03083 family)